MNKTEEEILIFKSILGFNNHPSHKRLLENFIAGNIIVTKSGNLDITPSYDFKLTKTDFEKGRTERDIRDDADKIRNRISADLRIAGFSYNGLVYTKKNGKR